jgi:hypothetical protein
VKDLLSPMASPWNVNYTVKAFSIRDNSGKSMTFQLSIVDMVDRKRKSEVSSRI